MSDYKELLEFHAETENETTEIDDGYVDSYKILSESIKSFTAVISETDDGSTISKNDVDYKILTLTEMPKILANENLNRNLSESKESFITCMDDDDTDFTMKKEDNLLMMTTNKIYHAVFSINGSRTAEVIENAVKDKFCSCTTFKPIRDSIDCFCAQDTTVVRVEIILLATLFDEFDLLCDGCKHLTVFKISPVEWLKFVINNLQGSYLTSMTCYPIPERRPQKPKMIFYHNKLKSPSLPQNSKIILMNTEVSVEHLYLKKENVINLKSKQISIIIVIVVGCGECG